MGPTSINFHLFWKTVYLAKGHTMTVKVKCLSSNIKHWSHWLLCVERSTITRITWNMLYFVCMFQYLRFFWCLHKGNCFVSMGQRPEVKKMLFITVRWYEWMEYIIRGTGFLLLFSLTESWDRPLVRRNNTASFINLGGGVKVERVKMSWGHEWTGSQGKQWLNRLQAMLIFCRLCHWQWWQERYHNNQLQHCSLKIWTGKKLVFQEFLFVLPSMQLWWLLNCKNSSLNLSNNVQ